MIITMSNNTEAVAGPEHVLRTVMTSLTEGNIGLAVECFDEHFVFNDYGIELEFRDKTRLTEFFLKEKELYPDYTRLPSAVFRSGDHVIGQWTLQRIQTEPWYGGMTRRRQLCINGVSVVQIDNGKVVAWSDYYDGLTARRAALSDYFTEWIEP